MSQAIVAGKRYKKEEIIKALWGFIGIDFTQQDGKTVMNVIFSDDMVYHFIKDGKRYRLL